ncbi:MAG TPA: sugar phosphate nucleotidyltransferase, partial [Actinomycetota bacterium]
MIGFCLAAGEGTRLAPLTDRTAKPLLMVEGRPLIDIACAALLAAGAQRVVVNAYHHAGQLAAHLAGRPGVEVVVEPELLGNAGGPANARRLGLLGVPGDAEDVLLTCADVIVDPADLRALAAALERHREAEVVVGLIAVNPSDPFRFRVEGEAADQIGWAVPDQAGRCSSAGCYALRATVFDAIPPGPAEFVKALL